MFIAAVALVASCSQDLTNDVNVGIEGNESVNGVDGGITIVASIEDLTRVSVTGDEVNKTSKFSWEVGDEVTVVYEGQTFAYVTTTEGRTTNFVPKDEANVFYPTDLSKPVAVFYNVKSIDATTMTAVYDVAAEQVAGELSNKMPFYFYSSNVVVENGKLVAVMSPLASVVDLELTASKSWNADAVSLTCSAHEQGTYAVASDVAINAATGAISLDNATIANQVTVKLGGAVDFATTRNVQAVVMGLTREVTTTETITNEDQTTTEITTTDLYAPIYHGKAVLKLYKNGYENARRVIWGAYAPGATAVDEHKHIYQPIADVLKDKVADGISTAEQMKAFADAINGTAERYPAGAEFSNEDGVVVLKNNIDLSAYTNWMAIGCNNDLAQHIKPQFVGIFDGGNNTISGLTINQNVNEYKLPFVQEDGTTVDCMQNNAGLFGVVANGGVVKNLTVKGTIAAAMADPADSGFNWAYIGGVVAQISGGTIENCTSEVVISADDAGCGKVRVGGIVGRAYPSTADIIIKGCTNKGAINLDYASGKSQQAVIGGIIGFNGDGSTGYVANVDNCHNTAAVTVFNVGDSSYVGGGIGYCNINGETAGVVENSTNSGAIKVGSASSACESMYVGGFIGRQNSHTINKCTNSGALTLDARHSAPTGLTIAGFVGLIHGGASESSYLNDCHNTGDVTAQGINTLASLIAAGFTGYPRFICELNGCTNSGNVIADMGDSNGSNWSGGFAGKVGVAATGHVNGIIMNNCKNSGEVSIGASTTIGDSSWTYGGGFAGCCYGGTNVNAEGAYGVHLVGCENSGLVRIVSGKKVRLGGISGLNNSSYFKDCKNSGTVAVERQPKLAEYIGGIAGQLENYYAVIDGCENSGMVCSLYKTTRETGETSSNIYLLLGGIIGNGGGAKAIIKNCTNTGNVMAAHDGTLQYNESTKAWTTDLNVTASYRGIIGGYPVAALRVENCKIGGGVGAVKGGTGDDRYEPSVLHKLNNIEGDTYYWYRWLHGYTKVPAYSGLTFIGE